MLGYQGLVTIRPNRGAVVTTAGTEDVLEVYALRPYFGDLAIRHLVSAGPVDTKVVRELARTARKVDTSATRASRARTVNADPAFQTATAGSSAASRAAARTPGPTGTCAAISS